MKKKPVVVGLTGLVLVLGACSGTDEGRPPAAEHQAALSSSDGSERVAVLGEDSGDLANGLGKALDSAQGPAEFVVATTSGLSGANDAAFRQQFESGKVAVVVSDGDANAGDALLQALGRPGTFGSGEKIAAVLDNGLGQTISYGGDGLTDPYQAGIAKWANEAVTEIEKRSADSGDISPSDDIRTTRNFKPQPRNGGTKEGPYVTVNMYSRNIYSCANKEYTSLYSVDTDLDQMLEGTQVILGATVEDAGTYTFWESEIAPVIRKAPYNVDLTKDAPASTEPSVTVKSGFEFTLTGNVAVNAKGGSASLTPQARWYNERSETLPPLEVKNKSKAEFAFPVWVFNKMQADTSRIGLRDNSWAWNYDEPLPTEWAGLTRSGLPPSMVVQVGRDEEGSPDQWFGLASIPFNWGEHADPSVCP